MNLKTAAYASAFGFVLSFLVALLAGIPLFDVIVRALIWGLVLGALAVGAETLLRSQLPDLFTPVETTEASAREDDRVGESVNIVLEEEPDRPFVEEIAETGEDLAAFVPTGLASMAGNPDAATDTPAASAAPLAPPVAPSAADDEAMPEIGSFLNSFRPPVEGEEPVVAEGAVASPDIGEYAPQEASSGSISGGGAYAPSKGADLDGMEQDPAILAKAVKSVMSKT